MNVVSASGLFDHLIFQFLLSIYRQLNLNFNFAPSLKQHVLSRIWHILQCSVKSFASNTRGQLTPTSNLVFAYLSVPSSFKSKSCSNLATINLTSFPAKNRPGQAWRPYPNIMLFLDTLTN